MAQRKFYLQANPFILVYLQGKEDYMKCPACFLGWMHPRSWLVELGSLRLREEKEPTD